MSGFEGSMINARTSAPYRLARRHCAQRGSAVKRIVRTMRSLRMPGLSFTTKQYCCRTVAGGGGGFLLLGEGGFPLFHPPTTPNPRPPTPDSPPPPPASLLSFPAT